MSNHVELDWEEEGGGGGEERIRYKIESVGKGKNRKKDGKQFGNEDTGGNRRHSQPRHPH
jgi:hypothetical protein